MDKNVNIYFKVEGLDGYISNLDDLKSALGEVDEATVEVSDATDDMQEKLDALEGGVKLLAGAAEFAAGALGELGLEGEFFEKVEENVFNVIALAQGAMDMAEGYRILAENQRIAAVAQRAFNMAANANPYVLLAGALVAAAGAFLTWKLNAEQAVPPTEDLANEIEALRNKDLQTDLDNLATRLERLREAVEGKDGGLSPELTQAIDLVAELRTKIAEQKAEQLALTAQFSEEENKIALAKYNFAVNLTDEELQKNIDDSNELIAYKKEQGQDYAVEQQVLMGFSAALAERQLQDSISVMEAQLEEALEYQRTLVDEAVNAANDSAETAVSVAPQLVTALQPLIASQLEVIRNNELITNGFAQIPNTAEETTYTTQQIYYRAFNKIREETGESISELSNQMMIDVQNAANFLSNLNTAIVKDDEKRAERQFKINKAAGITQAILGTAAAIVEALKAKTLAGRIAQVAFATAAGAAQIATISRTQWNPEGSVGGGIEPTPAPSQAINYTFGQEAGPIIQPGQTSTGQSSAPVQTYVLASDVTNAQQAQQQIQNLARL